MNRDDIIHQLEFLRDIGVERLDVTDSFSLTSMPLASEGKGSVLLQEAPVFARDSTIETLGKVVVAGEDLSQIRTDIGDCQRCKLAPSRKNIVFGAGNPHAELVFVGEAPGADEDQQGLPFVGAAGQLLTKIIESIGLQRDDVYICNILKCRPPMNRNPEPDEVTACSPFLRRQLAAIRPKIVCCLGKFAAQFLLQSSAPITRLRGEFHDVDGMRVIATFHPAYLLRSPEKKRDVWEDMKQIRAELFRLRS